MRASERATHKGGPVMEVRNCRTCRRLFNYLGGPNICPDCKDQLERKFAQVKNYVFDNPAASMQDIADENEVSLNQIRDWIKEGRLELASGSPIKLTCEQCGEPILTGRFCVKCKAKMADGLSKALGSGKPAAPEQKDKAAGNKMRFRR